MAKYGWQYSVPGLEVYAKSPIPKISFCWHYDFHTSFDGDGEGTLEVVQRVDDSPGCYHFKNLLTEKCVSRKEAVQKIEKWIEQNANVIEIATK